MNETPNKLSILEQLKPFAADAAVYGRIYADFHDLAEACEWFLAKMREIEGRILTTDQIENFIVEIDVYFVQHAAFHLDSLHKDLNVILENLPDDSAEN